LFIDLWSSVISHFMKGTVNRQLPFCQPATFHPEGLISETEINRAY
jgi:hypothetical protein